MLKEINNKEHVLPITNLQCLFSVCHVFSGLLVRRGRPETVISELVRQLEAAGAVHTMVFQQEVRTMASVIARQKNSKSHYY